jgi:Cu/Ag efflux protein CusF
MRTARIILAGVAAITMLTSAALAQQTGAGTITRIDRLNGTIAIQQTQSGTVGANAGGATEQFKVQDGPLLETLHAGDRVDFSATASGGVKTITTLKKQ